MSGISAPTAGHDDAINAALAQNWEQAVQLNSHILTIDPESIDALNRLAYAYTQLGKIKEAKEQYQRVLSLDPYNQIAIKNKDKLSRKTGNQTNGATLSPLMFLEEPGKTKTVICINLAPAKILESLRCGQTVLMKVKKHCIEIRDEEQVYLGALPDDISFKLGKLISGGNTYSVVIRSTGKNALTVFIREQTRGKQFLHQPSFTTQGINSYVSTNRYDDGSERPDTTATGEDQEE